jgi:hypothetical protein
MRWMLLFLLLAASAASANFAAAPGFSGRVADCTSCHQPPLDGDDAQVGLLGIPDAWNLDNRYDWTVAVTGGPRHIPGGPEAGFELEIMAGILRPGPNATDDVRGFHDRQATYTETGVFQREWSVSWTAPGLDQRPAPVRLWIAGMAANGNHDTRLNLSDAGEHGDSVHNRSYLMPPSAAALNAWKSLPLRPPIIDKVEPDGEAHVIYGRLNDANASALEVFDGARWQPRPAAESWRLRVDFDAVHIRTVGSDRVSPALVVTLADGSTAVADPMMPAGEASPLALPFIPVLLAAMLWRRS